MKSSRSVYKAARIYRMRRGMNVGASVYNPVSRGGDNYIAVKTQRIVQIVTDQNTMQNEVKFTVRWQ